MGEVLQMKNLVLKKAQAIGILNVQDWDETEQLAVSELRKYLERIFDAKPVLQEELQDGMLIVGSKATLEKRTGEAGEQRAGLDRDGFVVCERRIQGHDILVITSPSSVGTLYGVYAFLEEMGARFAPEGLGIDDCIPELEEFCLEREIGESPAYRTRGIHMLMGWIKEMVGEGKPLQEVDPIQYLSVYCNALDWMAKHRLNHRVLYFFWDEGDPIAQETDPGVSARSLWPSAIFRPRGGLDGFLFYNDYPKVRWEEQYGEFVRKNREMLRKLIAYGRTRGVKLSIWPGGEIACPGNLTEVYPELKKNGHEFCVANPATWTFIASKFREYLETFPGIGGLVYTVMFDAGGTSVSLFDKCSACENMSAPERIGRLAETLLSVKKELNSSADIYFRTWGLSDLIHRTKKDGRTPRWWDAKEDRPVLDKLVPEEIIILDKHTLSEPREDMALNSVLPRYVSHPRAVEFCFNHEHHGMGRFPVAHVQGKWPERFLAFQSKGFEAIFGEASWEIGDIDPTGINLGDIDYYAFARLAWNPEYSRDKIWNEWAQVYFPECGGEVIDLLRNSFKIICRMYFSETGNMGVLPWRERFDLRPPEKQLETLSISATCLNNMGNVGNLGVRTSGFDSVREAMQAIEEKEEAVELIEKAIEKLHPLKERLGSKYAAFKECLEEQKALAVILKDYVKAGVYHNLVKQGTKAERREEILSETLDDLESVLESFAPKPNPLTKMARLIPWVMDRRKYKQVMGEYIAELRKGHPYDLCCHGKGEVK